MRTNLPLELKKGLNINAKTERAFIGVANTLVSRAKLGQSLGLSGFDSAKRDLYVALGYLKTLTWDHFQSRYERQGIAKRIVDAPCEAVWHNRPTVSDGKDKSEFDKTWSALVKEHALFNKLNRADKLSGIGQYSILLLGFDGVENNEGLSDPASGARKLLYVQPYTQKSATINKYVTEVSDPRYGLPESYKVATSIPSGVGGTATLPKELIIHWSRVIHLSDGLLDNNVLGTPRMEAVYNHLQDLELVAGGSAEMFWRGAFQGFAFEADKDADLLSQDMSELEDEIDKFMHNLTRYIRVQGINVKSLAPNIESPKEHAELQFKLISGTTGIPVRILTGSERGELASSQDESNWNSRVRERMINYAEPLVLRQLVDRLIEYKILPQPAEKEYTVEWPELNTLNEKDAAEVAAKKANAVSTYASGAASIVIAPEMFLRHIMGFTDDEIKRNNDELGDMVGEEERLRRELEKKPREGPIEEET